MKKVKQLNGYSIYQTTLNDQKKEGLEPGEYYIYFSSDIRDFGRENSYPEYEGIGTIEEAYELCENNFAIAKEKCEEQSTSVSYEDIIEKEAELNDETDIPEGCKRVCYVDIHGYQLQVSFVDFLEVVNYFRRRLLACQHIIPEKVKFKNGYFLEYAVRWNDDDSLANYLGSVQYLRKEGR